jgi:hypothetical protein
MDNRASYVVPWPGLAIAAGGSAKVRVLTHEAGAEAAVPYEAGRVVQPLFELRRKHRGWSGDQR